MYISMWFYVFFFFMFKLQILLFSMDCSITLFLYEVMYLGEVFLGGVCVYISIYVSASTNICISASFF